MTKTNISNDKEHCFNLSSIVLVYLISTLKRVSVFLAGFSARCGLSLYGAGDPPLQCVVFRFK